MWKRIDKMILTVLFHLLVATDADYEVMKDNLNWTSAQSSCTLLGKSAFCNNGTCTVKRDILQDKVIDAWIGSYYVKSDWISYVGCHSSAKTKFSEAVTIDNNSVEKCYSSCKDKMNQQPKLFALQENYCFCTFDSGKPTVKEQTCSNTCKTTDDSCGSNVQRFDGELPYVSLYKVNVANSTESDTNKNCKVMVNGTVKQAACLTHHGVICKKGDPDLTSKSKSLYTVLNRTVNWNEARNLCRRNAGSGRLLIKDEFDASLINIDQNKAYWIGEFRLDQLQWLPDQKPSADPALCGGIFVNDTVAIFTKNVCTETKYALCVPKEKATQVNPVISTTSSQKTNTLQTTTVTVNSASEKTESSTQKMKIKTTTMDQSLTSVYINDSSSNDSKEAIDLGKTESSTVMANLNTSTGGQSLVPSQSKPDTSSDSTEIFIFIGLGLGFLVLVCIVVIVLIFRKKKAKQKLKTETNNSHGGDMPMIEGRALLLHQSDLYENDPTRNSTNEKDMPLVENKLDNKHGEADDNGEYSHLQFQGSRRDSSDLKDDTYDHATGMLDDDLYSKTNTSNDPKGSTSMEDDTYNHIFDLLDDIYSKSNLPIAFDDFMSDNQYGDTSDIEKDTHAVDDMRTDNAKSEKTGQRDEHIESEDHFNAHCQPNTDTIQEPSNPVKGDLNGEQCS